MKVVDLTADVPSQLLRELQAVDASGRILDLLSEFLDRQKAQLEYAADAAMRLERMAVRHVAEAHENGRRAGREEVIRDLGIATFDKTERR